jgi:hypothetical protein
VSGTVSIAGTTSLTAHNHVVIASNGAFAQSGSLAVAANDLLIDTRGRTASALTDRLGGMSASTVATAIAIHDTSLFGPGMGGGSGGAITFDGSLNASGTVLLAAGNGAITGGAAGRGAINVRGLGVSGSGGRTELFGAINGNSDNTAAQLGFVNTGRGPDNQYRFNTCAIESATCVALPPLAVVQPQVVNQLDILVARPTQEDPDAPVVNIFDEDRLCELLLQTSPETAKAACR